MQGIIHVFFLKVLRQTFNNP